MRPSTRRARDSALPGPADDVADTRPIAGRICEATGPGRGTDRGEWEGDAAGDDIKRGTGVGDERIAHARSQLMRL